jgi:DNA invertase Pin-like site-specific DNA recombinase
VGRLVLHLFASLAEFERDLIRERMLAGIASARARGRLGGRPRLLDAKKVALAKVMHADKTTAIDDICVPQCVISSASSLRPAAPRSRTQETRHQLGDAVPRPV